ncbi:hypothetical protein [Algoriphagus antarcticus]|uniref:Uncharacterized protein n=1 Tax=Algoriphagus antarcticus TaxID=238540 RepID=A0A3E0DJF3_9BACT|nr:hypothetical protein [Algoriphagus antarcticus]REG82745.1 hypothetical protein C8N25_12033 [Algoriphagus antarcticus]
MEKIILAVPEDKIDRLKKALYELKIDYTQEKFRVEVNSYKAELLKVSTWSEEDITEIQRSLRSTQLSESERKA